MPRLTIESLSHDARGVARHNGKVAFVAGALTGEVVEADLLARHRRFDEYRLVSVLEASADRRTPPCPLVGRCGGCDLQHLAEPAQIAHKTAVLLDQLRRQSGLTPGELASPLVADAFGYRRRTRLAVHIPRRGGEPVLGLRRAGGRETIPIDRCPVLDPVLMSLPGELQGVLRRLRRPGVIGHVELSLAEAEAVTLPVIFLRMVAAPAEDDRAMLREFAEEQSAYLVLRVNDAPLEYLSCPNPEGPAYRLAEFDLSLAYPPGGFIQGNGRINRALVGRVVDWTCELEGVSVLDAFCGVGNFALPLAQQGRTVTGLEVSSEAVALARENAARHGIAGATFLTRELMNDEQALKGLSFDVAVLDPPRLGARTLVRALASRGVAGVVYVSCSPATFARDAGVLAVSGYSLEKLCLVDMFPQTGHIESVAQFRRRPRKRARAPSG